MHIPAINIVNCTCGTKKGNSNNNTSFGELKVVGNVPIPLARAVKKDYSIKELVEAAEKRFKKDIIVDFHKKTHKVFGDIYKVNLYADNGFLGNLLNKIGCGKKIPLTYHHHRATTIDSYINYGLLHRKNISTDKALEKLGFQ